MTHKTLIDGTERKIIGGKTLINGTEYSIKNGKTFVDDTDFEVRVEPIISVDITGFGGMHYNGTSGGDHVHYALVSIDGSIYGGSGFDPTEIKTYLLPAGTIITCIVGCQNKATAKVILNGQVVAQHTGTSTGFGVQYNVYYDYVVAKDAKITLSYGTYEGVSLDFYYGIITIEE